MSKIKLKYSPEWQVLYELAKGQGLGKILEPQLDNSLNQKVRWFLSGGAVGVLVMIGDVFGKEAVQEFYKFLNDYINKPNTLGHYQYSDTIMKAIDQISVECQDIKFRDYLEKLRDELVREDKHKQRGEKI